MTLSFYYGRNTTSTALQTCDKSYIREGGLLLLVSSLLAGNQRGVYSTQKRALGAYFCTCPARRDQVRITWVSAQYRAQLLHLHAGSQAARQTGRQADRPWHIVHAHTMIVASADMKPRHQPSIRRALHSTKSLLPRSALSARLIASHSFLLQPCTCEFGAMHPACSSPASILSHQQQQQQQPSVRPSVPRPVSGHARMRCKPVKPESFLFPPGTKVSWTLTFCLFPRCFPDKNLGDNAACSACSDPRR